MSEHPGLPPNDDSDSEDELGVQDLHMARKFLDDITGELDLAQGLEQITGPDRLLTDIGAGVKLHAGLDRIRTSEVPTAPVKITELRVPADPIYLAVIRTATASVISNWDFTLDEIEDFRIAVDEASALLLDNGGVGLLHVLITVDDPSARKPLINVRISCPGSSKKILDTGYPWLLLRALVDEVSSGLDTTGRWIDLQVVGAQPQKISRLTDQTDLSQDHSNLHRRQDAPLIAPDTRATHSPGYRQTGARVTGVGNRIPDWSSHRSTGVDVRLSPSLDSLRSAELVAISAARRAGFDGSRLDELRLAVREACSRAIHRCRLANCSDAVLLYVDGDASTVIVEILDSATTTASDDEYALWMLLGHADAVEILDGKGGPGGLVRLAWWTRAGIEQNLGQGI